jgi:uncharacterized protein (TIGR03083 family)
MLHDPIAVRSAFEDAATTFVATVEAVGDEQWEAPSAIGDWSVRELTAHTLRAFTTIETYLGAEPVVDRVMADAGEYYRVVLADPVVHSAVAQRGRDAARHLTDPVGETEATAARVLAVVASTLDDEPVNTFAGQIAFSEYLASRTVELGVHTLDLQRATGQPCQLPSSTATLLLQVLTSLADPVPVLLALTGRQPLPSSFNVLG